MRWRECLLGHADLMRNADIMRPISLYAAEYAAAYAEPHIILHIDFLCGCQPHTHMRPHRLHFVTLSKIEYLDVWSVA